jgi:NADH dehydrogenase [ubiquinone] 1 alpha subcomplex assembly factor 1
VRYLNRLLGWLGALLLLVWRLTSTAMPRGMVLRKARPTLGRAADLRYDSVHERRRTEAEVRCGCLREECPGTSPPQRIWTDLGASGIVPVTAANSSEQIVIDFSGTDAHSWRVVTDGVMGGLSEGRLSGPPGGIAVFEGHLSLANNGGFASIRTKLGRVDLSKFDGLAVRVRGHGQRYRLRLRTDDRSDGIAYQAVFGTAEQGWEVAKLPFASFVPSYRGRRVEEAPPLDPSQVRQLGFMIADGQEGEFRLEIAWVRAYGN